MSGWDYWKLKSNTGLPMQARPLQWFNLQAHWTVPSVGVPALPPASRAGQVPSSSTPQDCGRLAGIGQRPERSSARHLAPFLRSWQQTKKG